VEGWEEDDNPFEEHLRLSPHCGWAIVSAIENGIGDYSLDDPTQPQMMEARKATFAGKWPHESKRGWKCKTKQVHKPSPSASSMCHADMMVACGRWLEIHAYSRIGGHGDLHLLPACS
jgi:hypothetical protein